MNDVENIDEEIEKASAEAETKGVSPSSQDKSGVGELVLDSNRVRREVKDPSSSFGFLQRDDHECENLVSEVDTWQTETLDRLCKKYKLNERDIADVKLRLMPFMEGNLNRAREKQAKARKNNAIATAQLGMQAAEMGYQKISEFPYDKTNRAQVLTDAENNWHNLYGAYMQWQDIRGVDSVEARRQFRDIALKHAKQWFLRQMETVKDPEKKKVLERAFRNGDVFKEGGDLGYMRPYLMLQNPADIDSYRTKLTREERKQFNEARRHLPKNLQSTHDYDLEGLWLEMGKPEKMTAEDREHFTDKYKLPNHPTFSNESRYSGEGHEGGTWGTDDDGKEVFTPSEFNKEQARFESPISSEEWHDIKNAGTQRYKINLAEVEDYRRVQKEAYEKEYRALMLRLAMSTEGKSSTNKDDIQPGEGRMSDAELLALRDITEKDREHFAGFDEEKTRCLNALNSEIASRAKAADKRTLERLKENADTLEQRLTFNVNPDTGKKYTVKERIDLIESNRNNLNSSDYARLYLECDKVLDGEAELLLRSLMERPFIKEIATRKLYDYDAASNSFTLDTGKVGFDEKSGIKRMVTKHGIMSNEYEIPTYGQIKGALNHVLDRLVRKSMTLEDAVKAAERLIAPLDRSAERRTLDETMDAWDKANPNKGVDRTNWHLERPKIKTWSPIVNNAIFE